MSFRAVGALWLLGLLPLLALACVWLQRRRRRWTARYASLAREGEAHDAAWRWRRWVPAAFLVAGLASLVVAIARPTAVVELLATQQTIVLAMDVSGSMQAHDVAPDRLGASQRAAKAFVSHLPPGIKVAVVSYGGNAYVVQPPTRNREDVEAAIDRFTLQPGTAIGTGLVYSLATVFPEAGIDLEATSRRRLRTAHQDDDFAHAMPRVAPGSYGSAIVVLLSDGQNTTGVDPMEAAELAARFGVRVFTVGFGTPEGDFVTFGGWTVRVRLDERTLQEMAAITRGEYFRAANGQELDRVYRTMSGRLGLERRETELSAIFAALGALLLIAGSALSLAWHGRII
jgi:Ca-activated chloride channel family protein